MGCFINQLIGYYEGDRLDAGDISVPQRPDPLHEWKEGVWAPSPPVVPVSVGPYQARLALNYVGRRQQIEQWVSSSPDQDVRDAWEYATEIRRDSPFIARAISEGVMTAPDVDALFIQAASL